MIAWRRNHVVQCENDIAKIFYANNTIVLHKDLRIRRKRKFCFNTRRGCPSPKIYERSRLEFNKKFAMSTRTYIGDIILIYLFA